MHFQPSELDIMNDYDINFWMGQLKLEIKEQNEGINKALNNKGR